MRRITLTILACIIGSSSFGQFYLQPTVGYTFSSHPAEMENTVILDRQKSAYKTQIKNGSGLHLGLDVGYQLKNNLFAELAIKQSVYTKQKISAETPDPQNKTAYHYSGFFGDTEISSSISQFSPLVGYLIEHQKLGIYFKAGPNFMYISSTQNSTTTQYSSWFTSNETTTIEESYTGKLHAGLQANLGATYQWKENISLVLDIVNVYNNYKFTKAEITKYEVDGNDLLDTIEDTTFELHKYYNRTNFSNYGISVGIRYIFCEKTKE